MKGRAINYNADELEWIEAHKTGVRRKVHADFCERFGRHDVSLNNLKSLCKRNGWLTGRTGCYEPGQTPANKGKKMPFNPNSAKTQFKTGQLPHNTKHLGHERVTTDGYVEISIKETNPHTGYERRYVQKHRHLWEKANGPVPDGMCLKCLDSDKTNSDPSNWEAIPRAMLPRLSGRHSLAYDDAAPELKPTIMAIAKLEHKAREIAK
jgi:HNH endonuclease